MIPPAPSEKGVFDTPGDASDVAVAGKYAYVADEKSGLRISEVCSLRLVDIDLEERKLFIRNSKERKDRIAYMSDTAAVAVQQHLAIRPIQDPVHLFPTQLGVLQPRSLQRRLVHYGQQCGVPVTAQRLRYTFASQMLAAGMPVSSLQRYLGHEHLDTTMIYAEVSDSLLR